MPPQMTPEMMQMLQQMKSPPSQAGQPQLSPEAAGAMMPVSGMQPPRPPGPPQMGGGFLGAAQQNQMTGAMPPAGDMPQGGVSPRMKPPGSGEPDGMPLPMQQQNMSPQMQNDMLMHMMQNMHPDMKKQIIQQLTSSLAGSGRGGDNTIAHLTPGEITVPPQVQDKKVLATLNKAFKDKGAATHQFTVGSPTQSVNPHTGVPEFGFFNSSFMKAALPIAGGIAGSLLLPGVGTALGASAAGAGTAAGVAGAAAAAAPSLAATSIGAGLGTTAGGLAAGQKPMQAVLGGVGAGVGGYALGNMSNGLTAMGNATGSPATEASTNILGMKTAAADAVAPNAPWAGSGMPTYTGNMNPSIPPMEGVGPTMPATPGINANTAFNNPITGRAMNPYQMAGGAAGSAAGGFLGAAMGKPPAGPNLPHGFGDNYTPGQGSWQDQLGQNSYTGPRADYTNFNPATNFPAAHNFYPTRS